MSTAFVLGASLLAAAPFAEARPSDPALNCAQSGGVWTSVGYGHLCCYYPPPGNQGQIADPYCTGGLSIPVGVGLPLPSDIGINTPRDIGITLPAPVGPAVAQLADTVLGPGGNQVPPGCYVDQFGALVCF